MHDVVDAIIVSVKISSEYIACVIVMSLRVEQLCDYIYFCLRISDMNRLLIFLARRPFRNT